MKLPEGFTHDVATNQDIPEVKAVIFQVLEEFGLGINDPKLDADLEDIDHHYQDGFFGLVKSRDKKIIATFALYKINEHTVELRKMYLLPTYRAKGIGKWMVHFSIEKAKDSGYSKLVLQTASVLQAAIALYRKTGFDEVTSPDASPRCDRAFEMDL